ncbi:MAG: hypothetical protein BGO35_23230 [Burkholderiales bacterium 64-34]|nr:MAG: hypothetical protein BGO35_23230 [Burkholderiales bacterium 64-34]
MCIVEKICARRAGGDALTESLKVALQQAVLFDAPPEREICSNVLDFAGFVFPQSAKEGWA